MRIDAIGTGRLIWMAARVCVAAAVRSAWLTAVIGLSLSFSGGWYPPIGPAAAQAAAAGPVSQVSDFPDVGTPESVRAAVADLLASFPRRYAQGRDYLARLKQLERRLAEADAADRPALEHQWHALRREALLSNPLVCGRPIVFVVRAQYPGDHHNTATLFQTGEINEQKFRGPGAIKRLCIVQGDRTGPCAVEVETLLEVPEGVARDLEVSFDGSRLLFSLRRNRQDDYHLYEIGTDGSGLEQLTFGSRLADIDPIYLPDGRILFSSSREPKYCMCNRHIMCNLFTMEADGSNIQQIGHSTLFEGHSSLLPDGRVLYDRWEYVDRNFGDAQGLWTCNPDGTNHAIYYGNNTNSPGAVLDARAVPGTQTVVATFSSCHDRPWGAVAVVDRRRAIDGPAAVVHIWPASAIDLVGKGNYDTYKAVEPKYEDPCPLYDTTAPETAGKYFICVRTLGRGEQTGIFLIDTFGNEVLIHTEVPGCFDPLPLAPRPRPPVIPSRVDLTRRVGYLYVADVYQGTGMSRVARGTVKYLRVVESPEKRFWTQPAWNGGTGQQAPGMAYDDFNNKCILGRVPVEADGSAYFAVPAERFVYFQLLDERGMMVQSMRSGTIVRPGETIGCVGCHEQRRASVPPTHDRLALQRPPRRLEPWYGPPRNFNYLAEVQPVFDRHCLSCHDYGRPAGKVLNLAGDLGLIFNTSYVELRSKRYVRVVGAGPTTTQPPLSWGSHASRLVEVLLDGHGDPQIDARIRLSREDFDRIVTWIDINAPYYPEYASAYRDNRYGRSPLDHAQLKRLSELTGVSFSSRDNCTQVSFTRPQCSPCLESLAGPGDPRYQEALEIIQSGCRLLGERPRCEMPGFRLLSPVELEQQALYNARQEAEAAARRAILLGTNRPAGP